MMSVTLREEFYYVGCRFFFSLAGEKVKTMLTWVGGVVANLTVTNYCVYYISVYIYIYI